MDSLMILLVTFVSNSAEVRGFEEDIEGYVAGQQLSVRDNVETQSILAEAPSAQLAASRQVLYSSWRSHLHSTHARRL